MVFANLPETEQNWDLRKVNGNGNNRRPKEVQVDIPAIGKSLLGIHFDSKAFINFLFWDLAEVADRFWTLGLNRIGEIQSASICKYHHMALMAVNNPVT